MAFYNSETKILHGEQQPLFYHPNASVGEVLIHYLLRTPNKITQVSADDGIEITCQEMADMMTNFAKNMMKLGFKIGDIVGLVGKNVSYATPTIFGCYLLGCPISPVDSLLTSSEIASVFEKTKPSIIFCDSDAVELLSETINLLGNHIKVVVLTKKIEGYLHISEFFHDPGSEFKIPQNAFKASETCATILRTTGTTEGPKVAKVSHAQLLHPLMIHGNDEDIFGLCFSIYSWVTCTFLTVSAVIKQEKRLITSSTFDVNVCFDLIEKYKVTHFTTAPGHYRLLMESPRYETADFSSIKCLAVGGWHVPEELRKIMQKKVSNGRITVGGGMTEIGGSLYQIDPNEPFSSCIGKPYPNTQVRILMDDGSFGGYKDVGEILVKRPDNFLGYFNNDAATAKTIDKEGWLHTGDVGFFDEKLNVTLIGRTAFTIRQMGKMLQPSELEDLIENIDGVQDVCVVGVPLPDKSEVAIALVYKLPNKVVTTEMVHNSIKHLEDFKQLLGGVFFVDEIALTVSGKIMRNVMKEIAIKLYAKQQDL